MMTKRRQSREVALMALYALEYDDGPADLTLELIAEEEGYAADVLPFARELVECVTAHREEFDLLIKQTAFNWDLNRIAVVDKAAIRIALAEIRYFDAIPYKVSIDEAIELGKKFSTHDSGKFINGILDAIGKRMDLKGKAAPG